MAPKTSKLYLTVLPVYKEQLKTICDRLGVSKAEYLRNALTTQIKLSEKQFKRKDNESN